jgi:excisionase family DNA binding protein
MPKKLELLTKQIAADRLGLSVRRIMEFSAEGRFTRHRAFDPETKREAIMFDADEIEAYAREAATTPAPGALIVQRRPTLDAYDVDDAAAIGAGRLWLTLAEAADYSGLPASILQAMVEVGELAALDVGVRPGGHLRIRRRDLDAIEGKRKGAKSPRI